MRKYNRYRLFFAILLFVAIVCRVTQPVPYGMVIINECGFNENIDKTLEQSAASTQTLQSCGPAGLGSVSKMLLTALYQESGAILVPAPLWHVIVKHAALAQHALANSQSFFSHYHCYKRFSDRSITELFCKQLTHMNVMYNRLSGHIRASDAQSARLEKLLWRDPLFDESKSPLYYKLTEGSQHELMSYLMCLHAPVKRYTVLKITHRDYTSTPLYLFIPTKFLHAYRAKLSLHNYPTVPNPLAIHDESGYQDYQYDEALLAVLAELFAPAHAQKNQWVFYVMGHGTYSHDTDARVAEQYAALDRCKRDFHDIIQNNNYHHGDYIYEKNKKILRENIDIANRNITMLKRSTTIAGFARDNFTRMLLLMQSTIPTRVLCYNSCASGGINLIDTYKHPVTSKQLKLSYLVIANAASEGITTSFSPVLPIYYFFNSQRNIVYSIDMAKIVNPVTKTICCDSPYNLSDFFAYSSLSSHAAESIEKMVSAVSPLSRQASTIQKSTSMPPPIYKGWLASQFGDSFKTNLRFPRNREDIANLPSVRLPGKNYFSVIDSHDDYYAVTSEHLSSLANYMPLLIPDYCPVILLFTPSIARHIIINSGQPVPAFVSMVPGFTAHEIECINASRCNLIDVIKSFFVCQKLPVLKIFHVKKLVCAYNSVYDIYFFNNIDNNNGVMFKDSGICYLMSWDAQSSVPENVTARMQECPYSFSMKVHKLCTDLLSQSLFDHPQPMVTYSYIAHALNKYYTGRFS